MRMTNFVAWASQKATCSKLFRYRNMKSRAWQGLLVVGLLLWFFWTPVDLPLSEAYVEFTRESGPTACHKNFKHCTLLISAGRDYVVVIFSS